MATQEELMQALRRADAAGDTAAAQAIARRLQGMRAPAATQAPAQAQKPSTGGSEQPQAPFERAGVRVMAPLAALQPAWDVMTSGMADSGISAFQGVKQLFGGLSKEEQATRAEMQKEASADPHPIGRAVAKAGGDIALTAIPGAKLEKVARGAAAVPNLARAMAASGGTAALVDGVTSVGEGETYGQQMASKGKQALVSAGMGGGLAGVAGLATQPFRPTAEAQRLIRQGVNPTLQQGAESKVGKFVGGLTSGAIDVRGRQEAEIGRALLGRITDGQRQLPHATGRELVENADQFVQDAYTTLFRNKRFPLSPKNVSRAMQEAQGLNNWGQNMEEATQAGRQVANILGDAGDRVRNVNYDTLRDRVLTPLSKAGYAENNPEVGRRILDARRSIIDTTRTPRLSPEELTELRRVDTKNFDVERMREATRGAIGDDEGLTLSRLATAYADKRMPGNTTHDELIAPAQRVLGRTPRQDQARSGLVAAGRVLAPAVAGTAGGLAAGASMPLIASGLSGLYGASLLGQTAGGARALLGESDTQRFLAELLRKGVLGNTGAALTPDMEQ